MKHYIYISAIFLLSLLAGCAKAPVNSDVEGFWKVKEITVLSTGETTRYTEMYYSITRMVTEVRGSGDAYISRTGYSDNETKLVLKDFKVRYSTGDKKENAPVEGLRRYGINSQSETVFDIVKCDGRKMTLQSDYSRLEMEKF